MAKIPRRDIGLMLAGVAFGILGQTFYGLLTNLVTVLLPQSSLANWVKVIASALAGGFFIYLARWQILLEREDAGGHE